MGDHTMMDDPLARFEAEHEEALAALARLELACERLSAGEPPDAHLAVVREVHKILSTAVRAHNENEERALFPFIEDEAPVGVFEEEHQRLRLLEQELADALMAPGAPRLVPAPGHELVELLRAHIARENEVLFPMARALLGPAGLARVTARLEE